MARNPQDWTASKKSTEMGRNPKVTIENSYDKVANKKHKAVSQLKTHKVKH